MKMLETNGFGYCSDAEAFVFTVIFISMFPTINVFAVVLAAQAAEFPRKS